MPMFYTPKPRQFHYQPRFYDPEKEKWEALKMKYALEHMDETDIPDTTESQETPCVADDSELAYFQQRVRELDREKKRQGLTWKDMFRKREMPTFNYQPRFASSEETDADTVSRRSPIPGLGDNGNGSRAAEYKRRNTKIKRRFDISDKDYMKPIPATRIMLYTLLVCLLLYWVLF